MKTADVEQQPRFFAGAFAISFPKELEASLQFALVSFPELRAVNGKRPEMQKE